MKGITRRSFFERARGAGAAILARGFFLRDHIPGLASSLGRGASLPETIRVSIPIERRGVGTVCRYVEVPLVRSPPATQDDIAEALTLYGSVLVEADRPEETII